MKKMITHSEQETLALAKEFARGLMPGDVVCLSGDLGAGKTVFTKGICRQLGVEEMVNSPTFTIVNEYSGANGSVIYHFDFYRLEEEEELLEIGFDDYLNSGAVCLMEWPEKISSFLPARRYCITIVRCSGEQADAREITIEELC